MLHGSQAWGGKGPGRPKMKHEKGFGCFMAPKSGWEGFGKVQNGSEECGGLMVPKSGVGKDGKLLLLEIPLVDEKRSLRHLTRPLFNET